MKINFNVTGAKRKELVKAIGEIIEVKPKYLGMPSAAYRIDYFTVSKDGILEFDDRADSEEIENLLESLAERGFTAENAERLNNTAAPENAAQIENVGLTIEMPIECVKVGNLTSLLNAKGTLIKKALGIKNLPVEVNEDKVSFPWFSEIKDSETVKAYTHFISALCKMSLEHKAAAKEKSVDNKKYAFRCFLLRLGFIGKEYKTERKILLQNLTGSSAFKGGSK